MAEPIPNPAPEPSGLPPQPPKRRKKRRLFIKVVLGFIVLLILLVLLAPAIISTSMVRSAVVGQVNNSLNGRVEIADWSIGWTGGIDAKGIKVFDEAGASIAQLDHVSTQLPLTKAIFGKLPLGKVIVDGFTFSAIVDRDGQLNFAKLVKKSSQPGSPPPAGASTANAPGKLPDISADVEITNAHGTIEQAGKPTVSLTQIGGSVKIPDINQTITDDLSLGIKVGDAPEGKITASGSTNIIQGNQVALDKGNVSQTLDVQNVDLHAVLPFVPPGVGIDNIQGTTTAHVAIDLKDGNAATADVTVSSAGIIVSGPALKGDTFATKVFTIAVPKLTASFPDGAGKWQTARIKVGADGGSQPVLIQFDQGAITAVADVVPQAILNLAANQKPGAAGRLWLGTNIDLGQLARQLKNTVHISNDVTVTGGAEKQTLNVVIAEDRATISAVVDITHVTGERSGKPISLQPIHLSLDTADQGGGGGKLPDLRDLKLILQSAFAAADFHGSSVADLSGSLTGQLQKLQSELSQFIDFGGQQLAGDFNITLNNKGDLTTIGGSAKASAQATLTHLKIGDQMNQPWLQATLSADLHHGEAAFIDSAKNIIVAVQTNNPQSPTVDLYATADANLSAATKASFKLERANVDFVKFQSEFGHFIPPGITLAGGNLSATVAGDYDGAAQSASVHDLAVAANHATIRKQQPDGQSTNLLSDDTFTITAPAISVATSATVTSINLPKLTVADSQQIISADVTDAQAQIAKAGSPAIRVFDMLQKVSVALNIPDLKRAKALADALSPPAPPATVNSNAAAATAPPAAPLPPLVVTGGSIAAHIDISHNGPALALKVSDITGQNIAFQRGPITYSVKPFDVKLNASVDTADGKTPIEQIKKVQVTELTGNLGIATLSMPSPIIITDLTSATPSAQGSIKIDGKLQDVTQLLEALQAKNPGEVYPYRGDLSVTENVGSQNGGVNLSGGAQVARFQVLRGSDVVFTEDQLSLANDLSVASDFNSATIKNLSAAMQSSGAMNLSVQNGTIIDFKQARAIHLVADLQYDLAKLWPIVHPMLIKPGQDDQYQDLKIDGQFKKRFTISGNYPAGVPFTQAIRSVIADGAIAVGSLDYNGLNIQNLELPVSLRDGKVMTVYGDKPAGQNLPPPAVANDGQLDLGNITVDLTQDPPRASTPPNKVLLTHATINPLFAKTFLAKVINNPVFVGANNASGLIDVKIVQCDQVPLGDLIKKPVAENTGRATLQFSLTNLHVGGEGMGKVMGMLFRGNNSDSFEANVKDATVSIAGGVATQHLNFQTGKYNLGFDGSVGLLNQDLKPLTVSVPIARIVQAFHNDPNLIKYIPDQAPVIMTGTLSDPQLRLDQLISQMVAEASAKALVGGVLPGANKPNQQVDPNAPPTSQPAAQPDNPLGDLLNNLEKKQQQKQDDQKKKSQPKPKPKPKQSELPP